MNSQPEAKPVKSAATHRRTMDTAPWVAENGMTNVPTLAQAASRYRNRRLGTRASMRRDAATPGTSATAVTRSDSSYTLVDWLSGNSWGAKKQSVIQHWHSANPTMSKAFARPHSRAKTAPTDCFFLCSSTVSGIFTPLVAPSSPRWVAPGPFPSARSARFLPALTRESMRFPFPHPSRETGEIPS